MSGAVPSHRSRSPACCAGDTRETAAIDVCNELLKDGAEITVYDPQVGADQVYTDLSFSRFEWDHPLSDQVTG